jgi:hypothetical protein
MLSDEILEGAAIPRKAGQRILLVLGDEAAVARNIGGENGGDLALHENP